VRIWSKQGAPLGTLRQSHKTSANNTITTTAAATSASTTANTASGTSIAGIANEQHLPQGTLHNIINSNSASPRAIAESSGTSVRGSSSADVSSDVTPWLFRPDRSELRASRAVAATAVMKQLAAAATAADNASDTTAGAAMKVLCSDYII
jgi:hypothetical protein